MQFYMHNNQARNTIRILEILPPKTFKEVIQLGSWT